MIVGGDPQSRGVVAACSYEACKFGIHSAMACATVYKRSPHVTASAGVSFNKFLAKVASDCNKPT